MLPLEENLLKNLIYSTATMMIAKALRP